MYIIIFICSRRWKFYEGKVRSGGLKFWCTEGQENPPDRTNGRAPAGRGRTDACASLLLFVSQREDNRFCGVGSSSHPKAPTNCKLHWNRHRARCAHCFFFSCRRHVQSAFLDIPKIAKSYNPTNRCFCKLWSVSISPFRTSSIRCISPPLPPLAGHFLDVPHCDYYARLANCVTKLHKCGALRCSYCPRYCDHRRRLCFIFATSRYRHYSGLKHVP